MSCFGGNCGCGADCKCKGCNGCGMYPDIETNTTSAVNIYCREQLSPELWYVNSSEGLRPNTFAAALQSEKRRKISIGKLPQRIIPKDEEVDENPFSIDNFEYLYKHGRLAGEEKLIEENFFTSPGKNISLFNFIKGADPEQVAQTLSFGLVRFVYPSQNLKEISRFPKGIYNAIKNFRTKVLKSKRDIFLKIHSSIPIWDEDQELIYTPHHIIRIGISNGEKFTPSVPSACQINKNEFFALGIKRLEDFLIRTYSFTKDDKIFINKIDKHHLVYSKSLKPLSAKDEEGILLFQHNFVSGCYIKHHDKRICPTVRKRTAHYYEICGPKDSGTSTKEEKLAKDGKEEKEKDNS